MSGTHCASSGAPAVIGVAANATDATNQQRSSDALSPCSRAPAPAPATPPPPPTITPKFRTGGWQGNFKAYVSEVERWHDSVMRTYYYGNVFVDVFAANSTTFEYYTKLYRFVKGIRGANASVPTAATAVAGDSAPHRTMHAAGDRATFSLPPRMR